MFVWVVTSYPVDDESAIIGVYSNLGLATRAAINNLLSKQQFRTYESDFISSVKYNDTTKTAIINMDYFSHFFGSTHDETIEIQRVKLDE